MLSLRKPTSENLRPYLEAQIESKFSYSAIGATSGEPPALITLGAFSFGLVGSLALRYADSLRAKGFGACPRIRNLAAEFFCRIVHVVDEKGPIHKFGFTYGTLDDHVERGEERFLIEWHQSDDRVWYDIRAFSRPKHILAWLGYPLVRRTQRQFGQESTSAMLRAVQVGYLPAATTRATAAAVQHRSPKVRRPGGELVTDNFEPAIGILKFAVRPGTTSIEHQL